uniref:Putative secreted protein n=1 Tax=Rhipicephalus microplus TaxID=6941 RepID=A0A6G5A132_RHIMP
MQNDRKIFSNSLFFLVMLTVYGYRNISARSLFTLIVFEPKLFKKQDVCVTDLVGNIPLRRIVQETTCSDFLLHDKESIFWRINYSKAAISF